MWGVHAQVSACKVNATVSSVDKKMNPLYLAGCLHGGAHTDSLEETRNRQRAAAPADKAQEGLQRAKQAVEKPVKDPEGTKEAAEEGAGKLPPRCCSAKEGVPVPGQQGSACCDHQSQQCTLFWRRQSFDTSWVMLFYCRAYGAEGTRSCQEGGRCREAGGARPRPR